MLLPQFHQDPPFFPNLVDAVTLPLELVKSTSIELSLFSTLGFEINYAQKGARVWPRPNQGLTNSFKFNLNYFEVPVYYVFESWGLPFELGPAFSYLLNANREFNGISSAPSSPYREYELGLMFSMNYPVTDQLFFKFRVTNSVSPILNVDNGSFSNWAAGSWHRGAGVNLTYYFNNPNFGEPLPPKAEE